LCSSLVRFSLNRLQEIYLSLIGGSLVLPIFSLWISCSMIFAVPFYNFLLSWETAAAATVEIVLVVSFTVWAFPPPPSRFFPNVMPDDFLSAAEFSDASSCRWPPPPCHCSFRLKPLPIREGACCPFDALFFPDPPFSYSDFDGYALIRQRPALLALARRLA